ncbi:hypothetical protein EB796_014869 [Bugula neritina]|uniref:Teneurin-1-4-like galactose-binding domain-containing protein n=1 Tax=Bugula neritina TaxID=10212 RepID=A0A7J7JMI3_BUGNE|nr:hypothetical protein EB796_014869 [Bugula neritina]
MLLSRFVNILFWNIALLECLQPELNMTVDAADTRQFNIPPNIHTGFSHRGGAAVSSASSANCSCDHNVPSLFDTEQDPTRQWTLEYHSTSIPPSVQHPGSMHAPDSFTANTCRCCLDNQSHILPPTQSHQGSCCGSLGHTPVPFSHYHQNIPHSMTRSHNTSKYQSGSYEPPWDLVYPSLSQLGMVQPHANHSPYQHGLNMATSMAHSNISAHNSTSNNMSPSASHQSHYRASNSLRKGGSGLSPNKFSDTHRYPGESGAGGVVGNMGATNTLATTASHSYETPWDLGDRNQEDMFPPPSSPPPPPPEVLRRPLLHYDGAALAQANLVQQLPQKKPGRRRFCNWRCIGIFLIFSIVVLAGCVAAFTYLLVEKDNSTSTALQGASKQTGPATDGNIGDRHRSDIPPHDFVRVRFYIAKSQFYKFNLSINDDAYIGVYGESGLKLVEARIAVVLSNGLEFPELPGCTPHQVTNFLKID